MFVECTTTWSVVGPGVPDIQVRKTQGSVSDNLNHSWVYETMLNLVGHRRTRRWSRTCYIVNGRGHFFSENAEGSNRARIVKKPGRDYPSTGRSKLRAEGLNMVPINCLILLPLRRESWHEYNRFQLFQSRHWWHNLQCGHTYVCDVFTIYTRTHCAVLKEQEQESLIHNKSLIWCWTHKTTVPFSCWIVASGANCTDTWPGYLSAIIVRLSLAHSLSDGVQIVCRDQDQTPI